MNEIMYLALAFIAGAFLGTVFFGGLWWTVRKGMTVKIPALLFAISFILRMALALAGFYWVGQGKWDRLLLCLAGFLIARFLIVRATKFTVITTRGITREVNHEA